MENSRLDQSVQDLKNFQKNLETASEATDDVKNGECTAEDERNTRGYQLYNMISEAAVQILQLPTFQKGFQTLEPLMGTDGVKALSEMMAVAMATSAQVAIEYYDALLKQELDAQFTNLGNAHNMMLGTVHGMEGAVEVLKTRINNLEKK